MVAGLKRSPLLDHNRTLHTLFHYQYLINVKRNTAADRMSVLLGFAQADLQPTLREVA